MYIQPYPGGLRRHHEEHAHEMLPHSHHDDTPSAGAAVAPHSHTHQNTKAVLNRLSRAIGHLSAVKTMVEDGRDCSEVLIQLAAVRSAINGICEVILKDHIDHCIVDAVQKGDMSAVDELNRAIKKLLEQ